MRYHPANLTILALAAVLVAGCVDASRPLRIHVNEDVAIPQKCALIFFVDGLDAATLERMLAAGELPHIQRIFIDNGVRVEHAVTSLPPITYPNSVSLITGCFPGRHGVTGNYWFDRYALVYRDYLRPATYRSAHEDFRQATIYEMLHDEFTFNLQCHTRRGASHSFDNWLLGAWNWAFGAPRVLDAQVGADLEPMAAIANRIGRWPMLIFSYYPGVDETAHRHGVNSEPYAKAVRNVDAQVGRMTAALREAGLLERTYCVLVSDHSVVQADPAKNFDLVGWLRRACGLRVYSGMTRGKKYADRHAKLRDFDVVAANDSARWIALHVRGVRDWWQPADPQRVSQIVDGLRREWLPAIELICLRHPAGIRVIGAGTELIVQRRERDGINEYRALALQDAADISTATEPDEATIGRAREAYEQLFGEPARGEQTDVVERQLSLCGGWHGSRAWLIASSAGKCPDFVPQIVELFDSHRAGDIAIFSSWHWTFDDADKADHGSCWRHDMRIPMFFTGPDLPRGAAIDSARLVDVTPTLLHLLGRPERIPAGLDGVSIVDELRAAEGK